MERFIEAEREAENLAKNYLKSSMERFIVEERISFTIGNIEFKIQYGEIYSE